MKLFLLAFLMAVLMPSGSFAEGVFGLAQGMSVQEIRALDFGHMQQDDENPNLWKVASPKKPNQSDAVYFLVSPQYGLVKVRFIWDVISALHGTELKSEFKGMRRILQRKYGEGNEFDFVEDSYGSLPYMTSLHSGARTLAWTQVHFPSTNKWNLGGIILQAKGISNSKAFLLLGYESPPLLVSIQTISRRDTMKKMSSKSHASMWGDRAHGYRGKVAPPSHRMTKKLAKRFAVMAVLIVASVVGGVVSAIMQ